MRRWSACAATTALLLAGCGADDGGRLRGAPLEADGRHLRDAEGRIAILRGVNARVEGVFDVTFDDGRVALEEIPPLEAEDCERMRALGFGLLRLPIGWSGVEPERGRIDRDYLARVAEAVDRAAAAGLLVLIDLHQDAYSKEIGEDGAPLWAIVPEPAELLEGPLDDLDARRQSRQVLDAFDSFFAAGDPHGLQADFIAMAAEVARAWRDHPAVIGFEIFNEPVAAPGELDAFHEAAAAALRDAAPEKLVVFEPPAVRNFLDSQPLASAPFPVGGAVYAPHAYTYVFGDQGAQLEALTRDDLRFGIENARAEADAWGTPLLIGEFGIGPSQPSADAWMAWQQELHDEALASNAFWVWKETSQGSWGVFDRVDGAWVERPQVVAWVSRVHAERIAADDARVRWRDGALEINSEGPFDGVATSIYVPEASAATVRVECDGDALPAPARDAATGLVDVVCAGRLVVRP